MEMKFDPMTGQPIQPQAENNNQPQMKFDPMTGEPVQSQPQMGFDPMTGEPVQSQPQMGFDPMTGQPVQDRSQMSFDPMVGNGKKKKGRIAVIAAVAAAAVLCCGATVFAGVKSGLFLGKSGKVAMAAMNTVTDVPEVAENMKGLSLLNQNSYTVDVEGSYNSNHVELTCSSKSSEKQVSGNLDIQYVPKIEFTAGIDKNQVKAQIPLLTDDLLVYNYRKENSGYLVDQLGEDTIDTFNKACETVFSEKEQKNQGNEIKKIFKDYYKGLEFKSAEKESFEVDGKDRKCKGYVTTIKGDDLQNLVDDLDSYAGKELEDLYDEMEMKELFDEMRDSFDDMPDMDVAFYIYKGKLACVSMEADGGEMQLLFQGGKYRMQNMELTIDGKSVMTVEGETKGDTEESRLYAYGSKVGEFDYNTKNGDYSLDVSDAHADGTLKTDRTGFQFSFDIEGIRGSVSIKKGAKIQKYSGDEFDIGNASKSDLEDLYSNLQNMDTY